MHRRPITTTTTTATIIIIIIQHQHQQNQPVLHQAQRQQIVNQYNGKMMRKQFELERVVSM